MTEAIPYLSDDWLDAASDAVAHHPGFADVDDVCVTQTVVDAPDGTIVYSFEVDGGAARMWRGDAETNDVHLTQPWSTAVAVASGKLNAQDAFIRGEITIDGDRQRLFDARPAFVELAAALASLRARTRFPDGG